MNELEEIKRRLCLIEKQLSGMPGYCNPVGWDYRNEGVVPDTRIKVEQDCAYCNKTGTIAILEEDITPGQRYMVDAQDRPVRHCPVCMGAGKLLSYKAEE